MKHIMSDKFWFWRFASCVEAAAAGNRWDALAAVALNEIFSVMRHLLNDLRRRCCWSHKWTFCGSTQVLIKVSGHVCINIRMWKSNWFCAAVLAAPILLIIFNVAVFFYQVPWLIHKRGQKQWWICISFRKSLWNIFNNLAIKVELLNQRVAFDRTQDSFPFAHIAVVLNDAVDNVIEKEMIFSGKFKVATWQFLFSLCWLKCNSQLRITEVPVVIVKMQRINKTMQGRFCVACPWSVWCKVGRERSEKLFHLGPAVSANDHSLNASSL